MTPSSQTTPDPNQEFSTAIAEIKTSMSDLRPLPAAVKSLQDDTAQLKLHLAEARRSIASHPAPYASRPRGQVSDDCARYLASTFIAQCSRSGKLDSLCSAPSQRDAITAMACETLGL